MSRHTLRPARRDDCPAIAEIYNHYVVNETCTYREDPEPLAEREAWFAAHDDRHPVLVAEAEGRVVGWGSLSTHNVRSGYRHTAEDSIYVAPDWRRRGVGSDLLAALVAAGRARGLHTIVAGIDTEQVASIRVHARHGFVEVARFRQVGFKFGRWLDTIYMQLML